MADVSVKIKKVPSDAETYIGVEYIESTGTQYLQLGVDTDYNTTNLYIEYEYTNVTASSGYSQGAIYSLSYNRVYYDTLWSAFTTNGYGLYSYSYGSSSVNRLSENATLSKCIFERNSNGVFLNGTQQSISSSYTPVGNNTSNITLFAMNYGENQSIMMKSKLRIYSFKLGNIQGDKYDLVPCVRKSDNVAGMYDKINKKFYTNVGTGEFVIGEATGQNYYNDIFVLNKYNGLRSIESLSQSNGQPKEIFYGIVANTGSIEVSDYNGQIQKMIENEQIPNSNMPIDIFVNGKQIQKHISTNSEYNTNTKIFTAELTNSLQSWRDIRYAGLGIQLVPMSLYEILKQVFNATLGLNDIDNMLTSYMVYGNRNSEGSVKQYLEKIIIPYPYLQSDTLYNTIEKICTIAQLNVFANDDGEIKFVSARPKKTSQDTILAIPKKMQLSPPNKDLILKNKYKNCNVETFSVIKDIDKGANAISQVVSNISPYLDSPAVVDEFSRQDGGTTLSGAARVQSSYIEGSFTFNVGKSNDGSNHYVQSLNAIDKNIGSITIDSVPELYGDNQFISLDTNYTLESYNGNVQGNYYLLVPEINNIKDVWLEEYEPSGISLNKTQLTGVFGGSISAKVKIQLETLATATMKDETTLTLIKNEDGSITCNYKVLANKDEVSAYMLYQESIPDSTTLYRDIKKYRAESVTINLVGTKITFNFNSNNETQASTDNNTYNMETNELMQDNAIYDDVYLTKGYNLAQLVKDNIINDYSNGISTAIVNANCIDVNDINGNLYYLFANGNTFRVGDIVRIDKDNNYNSLYKYANGNDMYFRLVGRPFRKQGVPLIDLELQEVK